ncbi:MAG: glycosyltransferase family 2 protein [Chloroflexaceae bacterium]|nr:glycosyltransferase family 2 protein [Chloroflexaceae bacterium]
MFPNTQPLLSVVICNYNHARYLGEAIESVLQQTYPHVELIVVDDGSTDGSAAIILDYAHRYREQIRPIFTQNRGQHSALRVGVLNARGEYICFLDSDDRFYPEKLATIASYISHYDADGIFHYALMVGDLHEHQELSPGSAIWPPHQYARQPVFIANRVSIDDPGSFSTIASCMILRRQLAVQIAQVPVHWPYKHYGDVYFSRPALIMGRILHIPDILTEYRIHSGGNHLHGIGLQTRYRPEARKQLIEQRYAHVNAILRANGLPELDIFRSFRWLQLAVYTGAISWNAYLAHLPSTGAGIRLHQRVKAVLQALVSTTLKQVVGADTGLFTLGRLSQLRQSLPIPQNV